MNVLDINRHVKLGEVFEAYPQLEDIIKTVSPVYKNLSNPILRKTVLKIATLEKVAQVGGVDVYHLVNILRTEVGQEPIAPNEEESARAEAPAVNDAPEWINGQPARVIDGVEMLNRGVHPLSDVMQTMNTLPAGQYILLKTNFKPIPLIEKMVEAGYRVHHQVEEGKPDSHLTYIGK
ncbi:DUF1858 domain-containing protein [Calditrichota bacterium GD2]